MLKTNCFWTTSSQQGNLMMIARPARPTFTAWTGCGFLHERGKCSTVRSPKNCILGEQFRKYHTLRNARKLCHISMQNCTHETNFLSTFWWFATLQVHWQQLFAATFGLVNSEWPTSCHHWYSSEGRVVASLQLRLSHEIADCYGKMLGIFDEDYYSALFVPIQQLWIG